MKTREVFRILRERLEPVLKPLGFTRTIDSTGQCLVWTCPTDKQKNIVVWCQMNKWPWDPWIGSQFVVEMQHSRSKEVGAMQGAKRARLGDLLTNDQKQELQERQNRVIAKFRVPSQEEFSGFMGFPVTGANIFLDQYHWGCRPVQYDTRRYEDIWLRIFDAEDVVAWAEFLTGWLPGALQRFKRLKGAKFS